LAFHLKVDSAYGVSTIAVPVAEIGGFTIAKAPVNNHPTRILLNIDVSVTDYAPSTTLPYAGNRSGQNIYCPRHSEGVAPVTRLKERLKCGMD
jgi:hypothetical protein